VPSVQETLEDALTTVLRRPVSLACAGRTDAGVHARGQVVSFDVDPVRFDPARLVASVNGLVGPSIAVRDPHLVGDDFDARFSCTGRRYRYRIRNAEVADPLTANVEWHVRQVLDLAAMQAAADDLVGTHDFGSFCRRNKSKPHEVLVRRVDLARWTEEDDRAEEDDRLLRFEIAASAFCHQMVRSIVGMLVEIGRGRRPADGIPAVLAVRDRTAAPSPAPPHGLVLWEVTYPEDPIAAPSPEPREESSGRL
jgi:tRNA pseudouridine38-40 synthase